MKTQIDTIKLKLFFYLVPTIILLLMVVEAGFHFYARTKENWVDDMCSIYRETGEMIAYKYANLSENVLIFSEMLTDSPLLQDMLKRSNKGVPTTLPTLIRKRLQLLENEYEGKFEAFLVFNKKGRCIASYPAQPFPDGADRAEIDRIVQRAIGKKTISIWTREEFSEDDPLSHYIVYATPIVSQDGREEAIGILLSWINLDVTNAEFFKGLELKLKPTQKPAMVLLSGQQQVLFHMGPCLPVKTYEKLPAGIIGKADNSPENPEETETLTQTVTGETREYFYSLTPARMSVTMSRHRVDGPEFQIFITAPSSIMRSRLSHTAVTIIMAALLFVALLTVPAIMIFRAFYDLEKERIKALEKELKLAYDIQMSLLPSGTVRVPGLDIFGDSIPARQVGGDFFDIYPVSDHELMVTIGDVSGKGMASALMMSRVKTLISFVSRHENNPLKVLDEVNSFLVSDSDPALFSTVLLGYVDVEKSIFTYAVAGHNPPLIIRDGRVRELEGAGTVLGAFDHTLFEQKEVALQGGDVLILYTDGFTDIWNEKREKIDEAWLWESALEDPGARSEGIAQRIFTRVTEFEGDNQQYDDRTLVVIKVGAK